MKKQKETNDRKILQKALSGELAAIETYGKVRNKLSQSPKAAKLVTIQTHHFNAAHYLKKHMQKIGAEPKLNSGLWGSVSGVITDMTKFIGKNSSLKTLKTGEEYGLKIYNEVLQDPVISDELKKEIRETLIPQTKNNINTLDALMKSL